MKVPILIAIKSNRGKDLWKMIEGYGLNLTEFEVEMFVYGDAELKDLSAILCACASFGDIEIDIHHK